MFDFLLKKNHLVLPDYKMHQMKCHNTGQYCCTVGCTAWRTTKTLHNVEVGEGHTVDMVCEGYCADLLEVEG